MERPYPKGLPLEKGKGLALINALRVFTQARQTVSDLFKL